MGPCWPAAATGRSPSCCRGARSRWRSRASTTQGAAYQLHLNAGAIAKGKLADLIVLDRNVMKIPVTDIENTQVQLTMLGGKVVWEAPAG